jgi:hypothetical protein
VRSGHGVEEKWKIDMKKGEKKKRRYTMIVLICFNLL